MASQEESFEVHLQQCVGCALVFEKADVVVPGVKSPSRLTFSIWATIWFASGQASTSFFEAALA